MYYRVQPDLLIGLSQWVRRFYTAYKEELAVFKLKEVPAAILHLLSDNEGITQQGIANVTNMKRSSISEIITEMMNLGYVERRGNPKDKRVACIYLTPTGEKIAKQIKSYFDEYCTTHFKNFSEEEIDTFFKLIDKIDYK